MNKFKTFLSDKENLIIFMTMVLNFILMVVLVVGGVLVIKNQTIIENKVYSSLFFVFATYELIGIFINWNYYKDNISFSEIFIYNLFFSFIVPSFALYYINRKEITEKRNKNKAKLKSSRENWRKKIKEEKNTKNIKVIKNDLEPIYLSKENSTNQSKDQNVNIAQQEVKEKSNEDK